MSAKKIMQAKNKSNYDMVTIICNKLSLGICDDVIVLLNPDEVKIHKYFNPYILS